MRTHTCNTTDLALAAALAAMGIPFHEVPFVCSKNAKGQETYIFIFEPASPCGKYPAPELIRAWADEKWQAENPEHPFCFIRAAFRNRESLLDAVKQGAPLVMIPQAGKIAILPANASPSLQTAIFSQL